MTSAGVYLAVIVFTVALGGSAHSQIAAKANDEDQITQLERDWLAADAKGDAASLGKIVADDFIGSTFNGHLLSKQDIIPQGGPGGFAGATPSETSVRIFRGYGGLDGIHKDRRPRSGQTDSRDPRLPETRPGMANDRRTPGADVGVFGGQSGLLRTPVLNLSERAIPPNS